MRIQAAITLESMDRTIFVNTWTSMAMLRTHAAIVMVGVANSSMIFWMKLDYAHNAMP